VPRDYEKQRRSFELVEFREARLLGYELGSRGTKLRISGGGSWQINRDDGKKEIRLYKEDFICNLKRQWDYYKSVARKRLAESED
jgi:hypothetical protein